MSQTLRRRLVACAKYSIFTASQDIVSMDALPFPVNSPHDTKVPVCGCLRVLKEMKLCRRGGATRHQLKRKIHLKQPQQAISSTRFCTFICGRSINHKPTLKKWRCGPPQSSRYEPSIITRMTGSCGHSGAFGCRPLILNYSLLRVCPRNNHNPHG